MRIARVVMVAVCLLAPCVCLAGNGRTKGRSMKLENVALPFGLSRSDLNKVEIMYGFYSAKSGAGRQELTIFGTGKVRLLLTRSREAVPSIVEAQLDEKMIVGLLAFMANQGFMGFEDLYPSHDGPHARRLLRLTLPTGGKTVALDEPGFAAFEMVAGAIKYAAGVALPEALGNRFFPNL
jgi:hypothetical protein